MPETMVAMVVTGLLMAALGMSMVVVLRQHDNSTGRMNNASSEQAVGALLPADLASSETVDPTAGARPCPSGMCPRGFTVDGSNALMAAWSKVVDPGPPVVTKETRVSWRYRLVGSEYQIIRAECVEGSPTWTCSQRVVLHDAPPPPTGTTFTPGTTSPTWAMNVVNPLAAYDGSPDPTGKQPGVAPATAKGARRVIVTVDGGGDGGGSAGGAAAFSLTVGSTTREKNFPTDALPAPSIPALRSRCGGNFGLLVDTSGSIDKDNPKNMARIRTGLTKLKEVFEGTPVKIQLVRFSSAAFPMDNGDESTVPLAGGNKMSIPRWYDMLDPTEVPKLQASIDALRSGGGTNYEDGFYRSFRNDDGTEQELIPTTLLFFTDGEVNGSRRTTYYGTGPIEPPWIDPNLPPGNKQDQLNRANYWAAQYRQTTPDDPKTRMIGVGVGKITEQASFTQALARLVSGTDTGIPAVLDVPSGSYTNADVANLYILPDWDMFSDAVESVALGMCGGTVTVKTVDQSGNANNSPVTYRNTRIVDSGDVEVPALATTVTTTSQYPGATFDFSIPGGDYVNVTIRPSDLTELALLAPVGWSCKVRGVDRAVTTTPIAGSVWSTMTVKVQANEPVSCQLKVKPA